MASPLMRILIGCAARPKVDPEVHAMGPPSWHALSEFRTAYKINVSVNTGRCCTV